MLVFCTIITLMLCSCSTIQTISYSETRSIEPKLSMYTVPLVADLQVNETRITYAEKVTADITKLKTSQIDEIKLTVLFNAIKHYDADVIVAPIICVKSKGTYELLVTVTGFPATYKNIRNASKEDSWFVQVEPSPNPTVAPAAPKSKFNLFSK